MPALIPDPEYQTLTIHLRSRDTLMLDAWRAVFHDPRINEVPGLTIDIQKGNASDQAADVLVISSDIFGEITKKYQDEFGARLQTEVIATVNKAGGILPLGRALFVSMTKYSAAYRLLLIVATSSPEPPETSSKLLDYISFKSVLDIIQNYNRTKKTKITSFVCECLTPAPEYPFRSALQVRVAIDGYLSLGFVSRNSKQSKELYTLLTTVSRPGNIRTLY
jgi:hypothetical protein